MPSSAPPLILGSMRFGDWGARLSPAEVARLLAAALDLGIDTLDLADIYGVHTTNALVGAALRHDPSLRPRLHLLAKVGIVMPGSPDNTRHVQHYDLSPTHLGATLGSTLRDLGVARVDTLMLHRYDPRLDADAIAGWVAMQRERGAVRGFGVSNFPAAALPLFRGTLALSAHQIELSAAASQALDEGTHAASRAAGAEVQAWSPLGGGALLADDERGRSLDGIAHDFGLDRAALLLRWVASLPATRVVLGTTRPERLAEAVRAVEHPLPADAWYAVWQAARGRPVP
ncbi:aldo/keto reductase [Silanimonas sp.]|jgi:predicted oxidoreductase|uniref:aldo/keto reductase n=1 Tax=Silanimonas sp. TaxID=1929290 RepID=UPI0022BEBF09|nr:aldo/keto reductase [Silanimonas sp.]MCZ8114040.1 aldo/keto reductase [Silanimonas sp.]